MVMGRCAYDSLPAWEREFWKEQREEIAKHSLTPDRYFADKPRYARYCEMPNGRVIPHGPTDEKGTTCIFVKSPCLESHRYAIEYYLGKLVETIQAGDSAESAIFAGVFGHFIQDSSQPAHLMHNDFLYSLVRAPKGKYRHLHRELDDADPDVKALRKIRPRLLGTTVAEAAFQLRAGYERMQQDALCQLVPLVKAAYAQDKKAMTRAITDTYRIATALTASAWHSAHCIARGEFDNKEADGLRVVRLNHVPYSQGFTMDPYGFKPLLDFASDGRGNTVPLRLKVHRKSVRFTDGIAMTWGNVVYDIPRGIYREFRAKIGILSTEPAASQTIFKVVLDGGPVVYEEGEKAILDHGGPIAFDSGEVRGRDSARDIAVPLGKAAKLTLITECPGENTHSLWVEPVLIKGS